MKTFLSYLAPIFFIYSLFITSCSSPLPKENVTVHDDGLLDSDDEILSPEDQGSMDSTAGVPETTRVSSENVDYGRWENIYFDYDSATIRPEDRPILEEIARWLKSNSSRKILIAGNCDERGTLEYNRALGQRRASAARQYLIRLGAKASAISTVSWGEEHPANDGHTEEAWAKNRRAEFGVAQE